MEKKYNFVYLTINTVNGKCYIGDHSSNNLNDNYIGSGLYLLRAIKEYGKQNFKREILEFFDTKEEAFNAQEGYIKQYDSLAPNGYNISPKGGHNVKGCFSEETLEKISKNRSGIEPWNKGKTNIYSEETKQKMRGPKSDDHKKKISQIHKGKTPWNKGKTNVYTDITIKKFSISASKRTKEKNSFYGKTHTEKTKKIISEKSKINSIGEKNGMYGKTHTDSAKEKIRNSHIGKKHSDDTKRKMSESRKGEKNSNSKLSAEQILKIKELFNAGIKVKDLAQIFKVSISTIHKYKR